MDSTQTPQEEYLRATIARATQELAGSLPLAFQPMAKPILALVNQQVASASLPDLVDFLRAARDQIDQIIGHATGGCPPQGGRMIENPPVTAALAPAGGLPYRVAIRGDGAEEWYDPLTGRYTARQPEPEDLTAVTEALAEVPPGEEQARLAESGRYLLAHFAAAAPEPEPVA